MKILITGGTGLIGQHLGKELVHQGHSLVVVTRDQKKASRELSYPAELIEADLNQGPLLDSRVQSIEAVIHLAGESVADSNWSQARKDAIKESRRRGTRNLVLSFKDNPPRVFISASAIGYYGDRGDEELTEASSKGQGFLADVCEAWEDEVLKSTLMSKEMRGVSFRLGLVLSPHGGALAKLIPVFQNGVGGSLNGGQAWMSWIHIQDVVRLFSWALTEEKASGVINATAPVPIRNQLFTQELARALAVSVGPPVPGIALKLLYGEMSEAILGSQKVIPCRALDLGYEFRWRLSEDALEDVCKYHRGGHQVLISEQYLPFKKEKIFSFFSNAANLEKITPPLLEFHMQPLSNPDLRAGSLINYKLKVHGVPMRWQTRIEDWNPPHQFSDMQLKGPYSKWFHVHRFEDLGPGTLMTDIVRYRVPLGWLGRLAAGSFVRGDIEKIFAFRRSYLHDQIQDGAQFLT